MNPFDELCILASGEKWCWKLTCTTCGHIHFRYAFLELAAGKSPADSDWLIHAKTTRFTKKLGEFPRRFTDIQKDAILQICLGSDIKTIARSCMFPDWLGYLGLILEHMHSNSTSYNALSEKWAGQLKLLVPTDTDIHKRLCSIADGSNDILNIQDLEQCERYMLT